MLKNRVFYVLLLAAAALIYIFTNTYYTLTLLAVCVVLPVVSLVLMLIAGRNITIELNLPQTAEKKESYLTNRNVVTVTAGYGESICCVKVKSSGTAEIIATVSESEKYKGKEYRFKVKVVKASQTIELTKRNIYGYYCYG